MNPPSSGLGSFPPEGPDVSPGKGLGADRRFYGNRRDPGALRRLISVFHAPGRTFADLARSPTIAIGSLARCVMHRRPVHPTAHRSHVLATKPPDPARIKPDLMTGAAQSTELGPLERRPPRRLTPPSGAPGRARGSTVPLCLLLAAVAGSLLSAQRCYVDVSPHNSAGDAVNPAGSANPLVRAAWGLGTGQIQDLLTETGSVVDACDDGALSPLSTGAMAGNLDAVQELIEHGADTNLVCDELRPLQTVLMPLVSAAAEEAKAEGKDVEVVPPPHPPGVKYGSDPDRQRRTSIVELLLSYGADPNLSEDDFNYPLRLALLTGHGPLVELLMNHGANPDLPRQLSLSARMSGNGNLLPLLRRRVTRQRE